MSYLFCVSLARFLYILVISSKYHLFVLLISYCFVLILTNFCCNLYYLYSTHGLFCFPFIFWSLVCVLRWLMKDIFFFLMLVFCAMNFSSFLVDCIFFIWNFLWLMDHIEVFCLGFKIRYFLIIYYCLISLLSENTFSNVCLNFLGQFHDLSWYMATRHLKRNRFAFGWKAV